MGTYTFKWEHAAEEVYVTGTFDNWSKSVKLDKVGDIFEKTVTLPETTTKIYYKFVVDHDKWITNENAPIEPDHEGNLNNFLTPEQLVPEAKMADPAAAAINTVSPESTTAALAGAVPLEKSKEEPIPTPADIPGGFPITPAADLDKPVGINPLPAAEGAVNPITLQPGEKIPQSIAAPSTSKDVTLDKESYEKADALPGTETELPPVTKNMIPESSLPIVGGGGASALINSVAPPSTTAALAGAVPLEPKVPEVVKESQAAAKVDPEASAEPEEVKEKAAVEAELLTKVPEAPSTSEGTAGVGTTKTETEGTGIVASVVAAAVGAKDKAVEAATPAVAAAVAAAATAAAALPTSVKEALPAPVKDAIATEKKEEVPEVSPEVPAEVKESIAEAGKSPEAAANTEAVEEKKAVEAELLKEVKPVEGESSTKPAEATNGAETAAKEPEAETPVTTDNGTKNGSSSKPAEVEKKKKHRISAFLSKLKHKFD